MVKVFSQNSPHRTGAQPLRAAAGLVIGSIASVAAGCGHHGAADSSGSADTGGDKAPKPLVAISTTTIKPTDMVVAVDLTGTLAPLPGAESKVAPVAPGRLLRVFVQAGQEVTRGQLIAELDPGPLTAQVQQAESGVRAAEATLRQAEASYHSTVSVGSSGVSSARTNVQAAQVALDKLLAGTRPEEIAQAESNVSAAAAARSNAEQTLQRQKVLFAEGLVAQKDVQAAALGLTTAQAAERSARQDLSLKQKPNRPQDIAAARITVQQARDALAAAVAGTSQSSVKAGDVSIATAQVHAAQAALLAARTQLANQYVRAPVSGTVVARSANPGESVDTTGSIVTIVNLQQVRVVLQAPSSQISAIRRGDVVEFTPDSQPRHRYQARVELVGSAVTVNSNTVPVEAIASNPGRLLRDDGFVRARVITAVHRNALEAPSTAVVMLDGKPNVFVIGKDEVAHAHPVTEGLRVGNQVEILSGLAAGDTVASTGAYELTDGARVKAEPASPAGDAAAPAA
ncbi:MAG: efflux RND transporter periplasmic adaptor subunit [Chloroflexi bacterium]|nr:efflux RND transporter periplasmic adaptor subunit [Chloroflexota bacterium]